MPTQKRYVYKFGHNDNVQTGDDVWEGAADSAVELAAYNFPAAAAATTLVSSDTADALGNTGATSVEVWGVNSIGIEIHETVVPNGTTPVTLTNEFYRVYRVHVNSDGGNANGPNVGEIDVRHGSTVADTLARIEPGHGQTLMCIYTVPKDWRNAQITGWGASVRAAAAAGAAAATVHLMMRSEGGSWRVKDIAELHSYGGMMHHMYDVPHPVRPGTDIRLMVASASASGINVQGHFELEYTR